MYFYSCWIYWMFLSLTVNSPVDLLSRCVTADPPDCGGVKRGCPQTLTLLGHPHSEAPLQPAVLAAVPGDLVDDAVPVSVAGVRHVLLHAAAEEALQGRSTTVRKC